jgi:hypothetical protein
MALTNNDLNFSSRAKKRPLIKLNDGTESQYSLCKLPAKLSDPTYRFATTAAAVATSANVCQ